MKKPSAFGKLRFCGCLLLSSIILSGCGKPLYAGTAVEYKPEMRIGSLGTSESILWYDGESEKSETITLMDVLLKKDAEEFIQQQDPERIPPVITSHYACIRIDKDYPLIPVSILNPNGENIMINGRITESNSYYLGNGWFALHVPNGCEDYVIRIGNVDYAVKE